MSVVIETLKATLQAAPDSWQCRLALVEALAAEGQIEEASTLLHGISELPIDLDERVRAGRAYGWIDPDSGLEVLDGILAETPSFAAAYMEKAVILARSEKIEKAKQNYYTGATLDPSLADADLEAQLGVEESLVKGVEQALGEDDALPESAQDQAIPTPDQASGFPVVTLREALGLPPIRPLVDPSSVPEFPSLSYEESPAYRQPSHIPEKEYREHLSSVELHPQSLPEPVSYNYQEPDDSLFERAISDADIYVAAPYDETGERIDDLPESLSKHQKEQNELVAAAERRDKVNSILVASIAMAAICAMMVFVVSAIPRPSPPQILVNAPLPSQEEVMENQQLNRPELQKQPMASSATMSMDVIEVGAISEMSMPAFDAPGVALGMGSLGNDFGMSMSFGEAGTGGAMFFGGKSSGQRFLFVVDHSISMQPHQIELRNKELERTLKGLRGVRYHVMLFAGGAYYVDKGWKAAAKQPTKYPTVFESPDGEYSFKDNGLFDFQLTGDEEDFPSPRWLTATASNIRRSIEEVKKAKQFGGTDWDTALKIAHFMDPPPDVIFFMTDGMDREVNTSQIVRNSRGNGKPKINCVAMQTDAATKAFAEIARRTNGSYTIVDKDGEPIDGFKYIEDPKEFEGRL